MDFEADSVADAISKIIDSIDDAAEGLAYLHNGHAGRSQRDATLTKTRTAARALARARKLLSNVYLAEL